jgi:hypothetical protein
MRRRVSKATFPDRPGVYVVYERKNITQPLYVGVAEKQSLRKRWRQNHLRPRAGGSSLRRSLGVHLGLVGKKLRLPSRYYPPEVEEAITPFLRATFVEFFPTSTGKEAIDLEREMIARLRPKLNVARGRRLR